MKYKGKLKVTFELLKEILGLDVNEEITHVTMTDYDLERETVSIFIKSNEVTKNTSAVTEAALIPAKKLRK